MRDTERKTHSIPSALNTQVQYKLRINIYSYTTRVALDIISIYKMNYLLCTVLLSTHML